MADPAGQLGPPTRQLAPARPAPLVRLASGLGIVLLSVAVGVLLALFVGAVIAAGAAAAGGALDR